MDLVQPQFSELEESTRAPPKRFLSLETIHDMHKNILENILNGCFLDKSKSSVEISKTMSDIFDIINQTCLIITSASTGLEKLYDLNEVFVLFDSRS
jgi:hypothetical protein